MNNEPTSTRDRGVSPVIGVVLMVAVTVILAATIGALVFGLSPGTDATAPIASLSLEPSDDNVTVVHDGGDAVDLDEVTLLVDGDEAGDPSGTLASGNWTEIDADVDENTTQIVLRHDPSGDIIARRDLP